MDSTSLYPRRRLRFSIRALLLFITACAIAAYWLRPPIVHARVEYLGCNDEESDEYIGVFKFRLTNQSPNSVWYWGFPDGPTMSSDKSRENVSGEDRTYQVAALGERILGSHGASYARCKLKRGESVEFLGRFYMPEPLVRAGVNLSPYRSGERSITVWSNPIKWKTP